MTRIVEPPTRPQAPAIRPDRTGVGCARLPVFAMIQCRQIPPMNAASTPTPLLLSYKSSHSGSRMIPPVSARPLHSASFRLITLFIHVTSNIHGQGARKRDVGGKRVSERIETCG